MPSSPFLTALYELSVVISFWLQTNLPQIEPIMWLFTDSGDPLAYVIILPLLYWSVNKELGTASLYLILFGDFLNQILKGLLRGPRPWWLVEGIGLDRRTTYGIPSGHTQLALTLYLLVAIYVKRVFNYKWAIPLAGTLGWVMALSRVYLGAHQVQDVILGYFLGLVAILSYLWASKGYLIQFAKFSISRQLLIGLIVPLTLVATYYILRAAIGPPNMNVIWAKFIPEAEHEATVGMAGPIAAILTITASLIIERKFVRFRTEGSLQQRALRYVLGIIVALIIAVLGSILIDRVAQTDVVEIVLTMIQFILLESWVALFAPMLFVRLNLAEADPA